MGCVAYERKIEMRETEEHKFLLVKPTVIKFVGWIDIIFSLFSLVMSWRAGATGGSVLFLFFAALGVYLVLFSGSLQMSSQIISYKTPLFHYQISWNEVEQIEFDAQGGNLVFIGKNKQLATMGWQFWSGKDKLEMLKLMDEQRRNRSIEVKVTAKAMIKLCKNTKVREN